MSEHFARRKQPGDEAPPFCLAAALSSFQDKLLAGETPDPEELLKRFPQERDELEAMLSLLYWGKEVLTAEGRE